MGLRLEFTPGCKDLEDNNKDLHFEVTGAAGPDWISDAEGTALRLPLLPFTYVSRRPFFPGLTSLARGLC